MRTRTGYQRRIGAERIALSLGVFALAWSIGACVSSDQAAGNLQASDSPAGARVPDRQDITPPTRQAVLGTFDQIAIVVFGVPELSQTTLIDADGTIAYPLLGDLQAAGRTRQELADEITRRLHGGDYVLDPAVSVNIVDPASQSVTVEGSVNLPGEYRIGSGETLLRAVARAQGTGELANERFVVVRRTVEGQRVAILHDIRAIRAGVYEDPAIYPRDLVSVGESEARRAFKDISNLSGLLVGPLIAILN